MPGQNLIQHVGGSAQKQTKFVPIFTSRFISGLYTNRSLLRGPLDSLYTDFYHMGTTDVLADGLNSEVSIRSTMIRRPGNPAYSNQNTNAGVGSFYSFHKSDGTIQVIVDTSSDVEVFTPTTKTNIFTKSAGAGQGYYQGIDKSLYICDGVDLVKYIPGTTNPVTGQPVWNFGGVAPTTAPSFVLTQTSAAGVAWQANTMFTTMGLLVDSNGNVQQLISVNADGSNPNSNTGTTSSGAPTWNQTPGQTTTESNGKVWTNYGPIDVWKPSTLYNNASVGGTLANPCIVYDPTTNACYIVGNPSNAAGTSGPTKPNFVANLGTAIYDGGSVINGIHVGGVKWFLLGVLKNPPAWKPTTSYLSWGGGNDDSKASICEPTTPQTAGLGGSTPQSIFLQVASATSVSSAGGAAPKWATVAGTTTDDNQLRWRCLGSSTWQASHSYAAWSSQSSSFSVLKDPNGNLQVCVVSGTSSSITPGTVDVLTAAANAVSGNTSYTGTFSPTVPANAIVAVAGFVNGGNNGTFTVVSCTATTLVLANPNGVAETHAGTATVNPWGTTYNANTVDNNVTWTCVGTSLAWAVSTKWYLPASGFVVPSSGQPYGGANLVDSNSNNQFVINSGKSGAVAPTWSAVGSNTTDNTITWFAASAFTSVGFSWTEGMGYCYAFKARKQSDVFVLNAPPLQLSGTNSPNVIGPLGPPTGCTDGTVTTASPVIQITTGNTGAQVLLTGQGSTDPQFDTVSIFRSADGFGASGPFLFLTDIPMPPTSNGLAGSWQIIDFMPDTATSLLPGLNPLITAPIGHVNDPPPGSYGSTQFQAQSAQNPTTPANGTGMIGVVYHQGRLWGFIGNSLFCSGGPDTNPGNGFTAWDPTDVFPFQSNIVRLLPTTAGLLVFTTTELGFIGGGPSITSFTSKIIIPGLGILSPNAVTHIAGIPYVFTSDRQFLSIDSATGLTRIGHNIGDKFAAFDPTQVYVTYHSFGDADHALFVGDGSSQWYRCDVNPAPDGRYTGPVWSPKATIAGGFKAVSSIETSPGVWQLLVGPTAAGPILARDSTFTNFGDNGNPYPSSFVIGNITMAHPGQMAELNFLEMDFIKIGSQPTVSVLFDEISTAGGGSFESISNSFISDPPKKFGPTGVPNTLWMNRYYFSQTTPGNTNNDPISAWCKSMQIQVDFGNANTVENELLSFTIFGALWAEK